MNNTEQEGIKAIIALQAMVGIIEPEDVAKKGWTNMSQQEQDITLAAYRLFAPKEK